MLDSGSDPHWQGTCARPPYYYSQYKYQDAIHSLYHRWRATLNIYAYVKFWTIPGPDTFV